MCSRQRILDRQRRPKWGLSRSDRRWTEGWARLMRGDVAHIRSRSTERRCKGEDDEQASSREKMSTHALTIFGLLLACLFLFLPVRRQSHRLSQITIPSLSLPEFSLLLRLPCNTIIDPPRLLARRRTRGREHDWYCGFASRIGRRFRRGLLSRISRRCESIGER